MQHAILLVSFETPVARWDKKVRESWAMPIDEPYGARAPFVQHFFEWFVRELAYLVNDFEAFRPPGNGTSVSQLSESHSQNQYAGIRMRNTTRN